jgi:hypothetical protein
MAKEYLLKLSSLVNELNIEADVASPMEVKHFFSGAALYVNGTICVSWSPVGLAFKLPQHEVANLIDTGQAKPLKYFPQGHIKKGYALFVDPDLTTSKQWRRFFIVAAKRT